MNKKLIICLCLCAFFGTGCAEHSYSSTVFTESTIPASSSQLPQNPTENEPQTAQITSTQQESSVREPVAGCDGLYQVFYQPHLESAKWCRYGTMVRRLPAETYRALPDFLSMPAFADSDRITYCILPDAQTALLICDGTLYQTDTALREPEVLCSVREKGDLPLRGIDALLSFPNSDLLFFCGYNHAGKHCVGSIDPKTGLCDVMSGSEWSIVPCSTGVIAYDCWAAFSGTSGTVYYWESGVYKKITPQKPNEAQDEVYVSPNGKYICTLLRGKAKDGRYMERYSVYNIQTAAFLRSFDWTFSEKAGLQQPKGFTFVGFDEAAECLYLEIIGGGKADTYQFSFGE